MIDALPPPFLLHDTDDFLLDMFAFGLDSPYNSWFRVGTSMKLISLLVDQKARLLPIFFFYLDFSILASFSHAYFLSSITLSFNLHQEQLHWAHHHSTLSRSS